MYKALQKHIKISNLKKQDLPIVLETIPELDLIYKSKIEDQKTTEKIGQDNNGIIFTIGNGKRSLKSVEFTDETQEDTSISKQNTRNVFNSINLRNKREISNSVLTEDNNTINNAIEFGVADKFAANNTVKVDAKFASTTMKVATEEVLSNTEMNLSDFFMMLSDWFSALDGVNINNFNRTITGNLR